MKKLHLAILGVLLIVIIGLSMYSYKTAGSRNNYKIYLENQYQRNLYELINNTNGLEVSLSKVLITGSREQRIILLGDVWKQANSASDKISALPISGSQVSNIIKYFSQVTDFSYAMFKSSTMGNNLTKGQFDNLQKLKDYCGFISIKLQEFVSSAGDKGISYEELKKDADKKLKNTNNNLNISLENISQEIQQYPTLIYDGPFSENILNIKPRILSEKRISINNAINLIKKFWGKREILDIKQFSDKNEGKIPVYSFNIKLKNNSEADINIDITKNGGHILSLLDNRKIGAPKINVKKAIEIGAKLLANMNYPNMVATYNLQYDGVILINYVSYNKNILVYPEQIKIKVAMDTGEVIGIESQQYLVAHRSRVFDRAKLTLKEAKGKVNPLLKIKNIKLTLIPLDSLKELLCYECYATYNGEKYYVYINAINGVEEKILKVINTNNGELTM